MDHQRVTRREFVRDATATTVTLGVVAGQIAQAADDKTAPGSQPVAPIDTSKIPSHNPKMEYRRLGKTGMMVSAVCLGGHSRSKDEDRAKVVHRCLDLGINYIDACTDGEVKRDCRVLKERRSKVYLALSHCGQEVRQEKCRTTKKLLDSLDSLLHDSQQEYTDLWRITCLEPGGRHTFDTACEIVDALEKAKKQGKARFGGFSSHDRRWIKFMIEYFPQIDVVCFPFTTMTKAAPKDSLFAALKKCDVGAFGIKPFGAGSLFTGNKEEDLNLARLALRYILLSNTVHPIPGIHTVEEADNLAAAVAERRELDLKEKASLHQVNQDMFARLPDRYQWLKDWEYV